jgi:hypothetical protein
METIITYGIIYLLVFRLAVLLLGGLCIFCGYRLFLVRWQQAGGSVADQVSELSGKIGSSELTIRSAAPGIFFSAFGAVIVIAVLAGSQPDVKYDEKQSGLQSSAVVQERSISMRGNPPSSSAQPDAGAATYSRIVRDIPEAIAQLKTAVSQAPENADYHDLLARLLFAWGEPDKAGAEQRQAMDKVGAERKVDFQTRLKVYEQAAR